MKNKVTVIEKGLYKHPQLAEMISVKEYMFVLSRGKKCLAQRFCNDSDFTVNSMQFTLIEFDDAKNVIQKRKFNYDGISVKPGATYVPKRQIVLSDGCVDYRIVLNRITSGRYHYHVKGNDYLLYFDQSTPKTTPSTIKSVSVSKTYGRRFTKTAALAIFSVALMTAVFAISVIVNEYLYFNPINFDFSNLLG